MKETTDLHLLNNSYPSIKNNALFGRYITLNSILPELEDLPELFQVEKIGRSFLNRPIHSVSFGDGPIKILGWSQMHGNESTTTKAVFDLFNFFRMEILGLDLSRILEKCSIKIIPMLNPDGAFRYTRENVNGVDLNRDAEERKEVESEVLKECFDTFQPHFCFNLHDQRSIYSAGKLPQSATLSFLAPAADEERTITPARKTAMQLISAIKAELTELLPGQIGRYDDNFNINCTGDNCQKAGIPTLLFEAGHYPHDYEREESRKYVFFALISALNNIASGNFRNFSAKDYFEISENEKLFCDVLLRNALITGQKKDIAIQFEEKIKAGNIAFEAVVQKIGSNLPLFGHREINCEGEEVKSETEKAIAENDLVEYILLKDIKISIKNE